MTDTTDTKSAASPPSQNPNQTPADRRNAADRRALQQGQQPGTQMQRAQPSAEERLVETLYSMRGELAKAMPRHVDADRMLRLTLTAIRQNPRLAECSTRSFLGALLDAASVGLEPNTPLGLCYLVPRAGKDAAGNREQQCHLQLGYQGMRELAMRSGKVLSIRAHVVYDGDVFRYALGSAPVLVHEPRHASREIIYAYAVARIRDMAEPEFEVLTIDEIEERRLAGGDEDRRNSAWATDYAEMARKTAIRALFKQLPKSADVVVGDLRDDDENAELPASIEEALGKRGGER